MSRSAKNIENEMAIHPP